MRSCCFPKTHSHPSRWHMQHFRLMISKVPPSLHFRTPLFRPHPGTEITWNFHDLKLHSDTIIPSFYDPWSSLISKSPAPWLQFFVQGCFCFVLLNSFYNTHCLPFLFATNTLENFIAELTHHYIYFASMILSIAARTYSKCIDWYPHRLTAFS